MMNEGTLARTRRALALGLVLAAAALLAACGYSLRGTGSFLPPEMKTIHVPTFTNKTTRFELDRTLTTAVIDEFVARGKVEIISDPKAADATLAGTILGFNASPSGFSRSGSADHYTIYLVVSVVLTEAKTQRVIYTNPSYVFNEDYQVPEGRDFESVQTEALKKIAEKFARNLVVSILEGF
jgi:outer membrane lipopolysaccharide assembly protein LptE/RlpB